MGTGNAGDPSPVAHKGETDTVAAHLPRSAEIRQPPRAPAAHQGERELFRTTEYTERRSMSGKIRNPARRCKICGGKCEKQMRYCKLCAREVKEIRKGGAD